MPYTYFLKANSLIGLDMYVLSIDFVGDACDNAAILELD
jgi:hypothetical protein